VNNPSPSIVSRSAAARLPRWAMWAFVLAYVLPGFVGREPWKDHDVVAFGVMRDMALGLTSWTKPLLLGLPVEHTGWLHHWLGAVFISMWPAQAEWMARLPFIALLGMTLACTWWSVYHLARLPAAQPVAFAFGGEADPHDYARTLADAGVLALMACLGLAQLGHETSADTARLAMVSLMLMAASALTRPRITSVRWTPAAWTLGVAGLALSGAPWMASMLSVGLLSAAAWSRPADGVLPSDRRAWAAAALGSVLVLSLAGVMGAFHEPQWSMLRWGDSALAYGRLLVWFSWPAWPLVLWSLWRWRQQWSSPHVLLPLLVMALITLGSALLYPKDRTLLLALPAFATLAAFALPTLSRSVSAFIDWFTLLFFSVCAVVLWVVWLAMQTGWPEKTARNVERLAPGFEASFSLLALVVALVATAAWVMVLNWRAGRHSPVLWKSLVLPAAGAVVSWLLLTSLWLPLLNHGMSHGPQSRAVLAALPGEQRCVLVDQLPNAQLHALRYHTPLVLQRNLGKTFPTTCTSLLTSPQGHNTLHQRMDMAQWHFQGRIKRLGRSRDDILIYVRNASSR